jgi:molybdopterin biosynthesis enzyme
MSVDPDDLTPAAIRQSGAILVTQGIPMQPGNMLTMAYPGKTMLMGVPGASMHSSVTSLDVFLPRVFAGIEITKEEITGYSYEPWHIRYVGIKAANEIYAEGIVLEEYLQFR